MRLLGALTILALATPAWADWIRLRAPGLELYTDAGAGTARQALRRLEQIRQVFPVNGTISPRPLRVFLFSSAGEFAKFSQQEGDAGFYQSGLESDAIVTHAGEGINRVVVHEYIHFLIHQGDARLPKWLEEGLAEFYSNAELSRNRVRIGEPLKNHVALLKQRQMLPAAKMLEPDAASDLYYAQAWAMAHMLNLAPKYREAMPAFASALAEGRDENEAFVAAFGRPLDEALDDLDAYLLTMRATSVSVPPMERNDEAESEKLIEPEAILLRASLALDTGRLDTAEPLFAEAARKFPEFGRVAAGLGSLAYAKGDRREARRQLERAVELDPTDGAVWFQLALVEQSEGASDARVGELLERAISENPTLGEPHVLLGVRATDAGDLDRAVDHLRQAARLMPRESYVWHALAYAGQKRGDVDALASARQALRTAESPEQVRMAEALIDSLRVTR